MIVIYNCLEMTAVGNHIFRTYLVLYNFKVCLLPRKRNTDF